MADEFRRNILEAVARGDLAPAEAASRLDSAPAGPAPASEPEVARITVEAELGSVQVVADPAVTGATAEGPHTAEREGSTLVFRTVGDTTAGALAFVFGRRGLQALAGDRPLQIRMNPSLALSLEVEAGKVRVRGVRGPISASVQAGSVTIEEFAAPLQLNVQAGSVHAQGLMAAGASTVNCAAGVVRLLLDPASSVRIRGRATGGVVSIDGRRAARDTVIGEGAGTLQVDTVAGSVRIETAR